MKKGMWLSFAILMIGVFVLVGCGQQNPTINTLNTRPSNLTIRGTVFGTTLSLQKGDPIASASVVISGAKGTYYATTSANGEYTLSDIPDGAYNLIVTAEGHTRSSTNLSTLKPTSGIPADGTITVTDIQLSSLPIILSYSPVPTSVITANQTFVVTFNEPMDTTSVMATLTAAGIRTMTLPTAGNVAITTTWNAANKQLTIVPKATLISNESYTVAIVTGANGAKDTAGNQLTAVAEQANAASATFRVGTGTGLPGDPTNLAIVYTATTECDYTRVYGSNNIFLSWLTPTTGGPITSYNVYVAYGAGGNFALANTTSIIGNQFTLTSTVILNALYGTGAARDPVCSGGYPFINDSLRIKVVALNGDGESATGATITARDTLGPTLNANNDSTMANPAKLDNNVLLPALTSGQAYISFTEPITSVGAAALYHIGTYEATAATLVSNAAVVEAAIAHLAGARSVVKVTVPGPITGGWTASVEAGAATDLSGNASPAQAGFGIN